MARIYSISYVPKWATVWIVLASCFTGKACAQIVVPSGTAFDLGAGPGDTNTIDVTPYTELGSIFWNADSTAQESQANDENFPPFGDEDLRDNLPAYITAGPGADYAGVSGGWNYQRILAEPGGTDFLGGVATTPPAGGEVATFTVGAGAPEDLQFNLVVDILDGTQFVPSSLTVAAGDAMASVDTSNVNLNGDVYSFDILGLSQGDVVSVSLGPAASINTLVGVGLASAEPFQLDLQIDRVSGMGTILHNGTGSDVELQGYSLTSTAGALDPLGWNSLQDQGQADQGAGAGNTDPTDGVGWEELAGGGDANYLGEFNLQSSTLLGSGGDLMLDLGDIFSPGGTEDVQITYSFADGREVTLDAEFFSGSLPGDFNNDGVVNASDLNDPTQGWQARFSAGDLGGSDFLVWQRNFDPGANLAAIPEPGAIALALGLAGALVCRRRTSAAVALLVVPLLLATDAHASFTLDRDYQLGDDPAENASAGAAVGSGSGAGGFTFDSAGVPNMDQLIDLAAQNGPLYVNVSGRPLGSGLGVQFDGVDDYLETERLGLPETSVSAIGGSNPGTLDYSGISDRGYQFWVRPDAAAQNRVQALISDTDQHAVAISANNTWLMRYGGTEFDTGVGVSFDDWSHVMLVRPLGAANGARLYVDGVGVGAIPGGYNGASEFPLIVGANTGNLLGDPSQLPGTSEFFDGIIDDLEMFILGVSAANSIDYGTFQFETDNEFAADALASYVPGDATGDGVVMGDGSGGADDDVAVFVANWRESNAINGVVLGDINSPARADFNFDGRIGLLDWDILVAGHSNGSSLNLASLLGVAVPEPSTMCLVISMGAGLLVGAGRRRPNRFHEHLSPRPTKRWSRAGIAAALAGLLVVVAGRSAEAQVSFGGVVPNTGGDLRASATLTGPNAGLTYDGSLFFDANSADQDSQVNDETAGNPFGDIDLRDNLPSYISAGPGADYAGVSGGWGYQQVLDDFGAQFESGVATTSAGSSQNIVDLTVGTGAPNDILLGLYIDNLDNGAFVADSITVQLGGNSASAITQTPNLDGDYYFFLMENVSPSDVISIQLGPAATFPTLGGLQVGDGSGFTSLFDPDPVLTIDRLTGQMTLSNGTGSPIDFRAYEIESNAGALSPATWLSIADNYDADDGGEFDPTSNWLEFTDPADRDNLAEGQQPGAGASLAHQGSIDLGTAWLQSFTEDVTMQLLQNDQSLRTVQVIYAGNNGNALPVGDLNADGNVTVADWNLFKPLVNGDLSGLSPVEQYRGGDLIADGLVNLADARAFATAFDAANGSGAFAAMIDSVPEPSTAFLFWLSTALGLACRRAGGRSASTD